MAFYVLGQQLIEKASFCGLCEAVVEHAGHFVSQEQGSPLYGGDDSLVRLQQSSQELVGFKGHVTGLLGISRAARHARAPSWRLSFP